MVTDFDIANEVAETLSRLYGYEDWFVGISVDFDDDTRSFFVRVRVTTDDYPKHISSNTCVKVVVERVDIPRIQ
jgi:hypothetical protein